MKDFQTAFPYIERFNFKIKFQRPGQVKFGVIFILIFFHSTVFGQNTLFDIVSATGKYSFSHQTPPDPLASLNPSINNQGYEFEWLSCSTPEGPYTRLSIGSNGSYNFSLALTQTTFFKRVARKNGVIISSNIIRYEAVSTQWEDQNYLRIHELLKPGLTTWQQVDILPVGDKLVRSTYMDGMGRPLQTVDKEIATPATGSTIWGDIVQPSQYDVYLNRSSLSYLPYTTTQQLGKYKPEAVAETKAYYLSKYNDARPFAETSLYDNSPLNRSLKQKAPGEAWNVAGTNPVEVAYLLNETSDDVKRFTIGYGENDIPGLHPTAPLYPDNSLAKSVSYDEYQKAIITYTDDEGKQILKKVQISATVNPGYQGWICTYYVYDDFGRLRCEINPEGVEWLRLNNWAFAGTVGTTVFEQQCFIYGYDYKGRTVYKKQPGQKPLRMLYDRRDRLVCTQDGNQDAKVPKEWTAYRYDDLDRVMVVALYQTSLTAAQLAQQVDQGAELLPINSAGNGLTCTNCTPLKFNYYDGKSFTGQVGFASTIAAKAAVAPAGSNQRTIAVTTRVRGFATGALVNVLGTTQMLATSLYFDAWGNLIQEIKQNLTLASDYQSFQYAWDGRLLGKSHQHGFANGVMNAYEIKDRYSYDKIGRVNKTEQQYGANAWRQMVTQTFDDLGRVAGKRLSPSFNSHFTGIGTPGTGLENLAYSYNIQGSLTGVNKAFALKETGYSKWKNFFGLYLHYADRSGTSGSEAFNGKSRYNGQLEGVAWTTQGDDAQRRYTYDYDAAGRMTIAIFAQRAMAPQAFGNTTLNFTEGGQTPIQYDLNGNLKRLTRMGWQAGVTSPVMVDDLTYSYQSFSNKLLSVRDNATITPTATVGDFKELNTTNNDYLYDNNGNLIADLNKGIMKNNDPTAAAIKYNHLDKPYEIDMGAKGKVYFTYDANGVKLKRAFVSGNTALGTKVTWYMGAYQYEEVTGGTNPQAVSLSFIGFSEGRIRPITAVNTSNGYDALAKDALLTLPGSKKGSIDYFITDHRSDVRMILTEETQWSYTTASMETLNGRNATEEAIFGLELTASRVAKSTVPAWASNTSQQVTRLSSSTQKIGPNQLLKVMAGDLISTNVQYYFNTISYSDGGSTLGPNVINTLAGILTSSATISSAIKTGVPGISANLGATGGFGSWLHYNASNAASALPKAQLSVLFFDERFNFVSESSQLARVTTMYDGAAPLALLNIKVPKNGYCLVYISNESSIPVYFDSMQVRHDRGRILEENHYYAYGLKIEALSSKAFGSAPNNYKYQGDYSEFDDDLGWNDFELRSYDPQIGRFLQHDPYDQFASGYVGMGNDPGNMVDEDGGWSWFGNSTKAVISGSSDAVGVVVKPTAAQLAASAARKAAKANSFWSGAIDATKGLIMGLAVMSSPFEMAKQQFTSVVNVTQAINKGDYETALQYEPTGLYNLGTTINKAANGDSYSQGALAVNVVAAVLTKKVAARLPAAKPRTAPISNSKPAKAVRKIPCGCFVAGTLILTQKGTKPIEAIDVGDVVWSYNDTTGVYGQKRVKTLFKYQRDSIYHIQVGKEVIKATADHPFYIGGRWLRVVELKVGDSVKLFDGSNLVIEQITIVPGRTTVYNFEVEDYHTYYISHTKVLVHNFGPCDDAAGKPHSNATSGNNKYSQTGKQKHKELDERIKEKDGWEHERGKAGFEGTDGNMYYPDVKTPSGNYLEYKPLSPRGISRGRTQINKYQRVHPNPNVKFRVIYYKP